MHSISRAAAKGLFYSGDFRAHGRKAALFKQIISKPPRNIDVLMMEGSSFGRISESQRFSTETEVEDKLTEVLAKNDRPWTGPYIRTEH